MSGNRPWTLDEIDDLHRLDWDRFKFAYPDRTADAYRIKRNRTKPSDGPRRDFSSDKHVGDFNWRDANRVVRQLIDLKSSASYSQDQATVKIATDQPVCVVGICDTHIGSWGTDYELFERVTDELLAHDNLYVALLGDLQQMAIKLRGVLEVSDNALTPELQHRYIESWLAEVGHKILFSTWDNHAVEREEAGSGFSMYAELMKRRVVWHNGIGHPDIRVGDQTYKFAVSHRFKGRSQNNPCHGAMQYLVREGHDREIAMAGDSHVPGLLHFTHGPMAKLAVNGGSLQTNSGYGKRYFSLTTHPVFPAVVLWPDEHRFEGVWSVGSWLAMRDRPGGRAPLSRCA